MLDNGLDKCSCPKTKCVRHGNCKDCSEYHAKSLPRCKRERKNILNKLFKWHGK